MGLFSALVVFIVSLIIGGFGIYIGAHLLIDEDSGFLPAVITALIGAIVWGIVAFFVGWIPLIGPLLALIAWVGVVNWRYPGGWITAAGIGIISWIAAIVVIFLLKIIGLQLEAVGIPGV